MMRTDDDATTQVSVIVPVYNPGPYLERCIESIVGQSLPPDAFEAIFVDDGSTDESPARLDALAATHPNVRVIHQPNSGWPGKPRNVGIDAARGRYVYFVDHDDALGPEALERLVAFADRNQSDIVIGKMAGHGRGAPHQLFLETRDRVTIHDSGIIGALSPHKLFRTSFLDTHALRYPEGRRRLEDQEFVVAAYFAARVISILSDYTCYYHLARDDRANAASGAYDPSGRFDAAYYYSFLRRVLDIVERNTSPGPERDRLQRRFLNRELLGRLTGPRFLKGGAKRRRRLVDEVRSVVERYVAPTADRYLAPPLRVRMQLLRQGRDDLLFNLARAELGVRVATRFRRIERLDGRRSRLRAEAELVGDDGPLRFRRDGDRLLLPLPADIAAAVPEDARAVELPIKGEAQVILRRRRDSADVTLRVPSAWRLVNGRGGTRVVHDVEVIVDGDDPTEDHALRTGRWDVLVRVYLVGYHLEAPLRRPSGPARSRPVAIVDGVPARLPARWDVQPGIGLLRRATVALWPLVPDRLARRLRR